MTRGTSAVPRLLLIDDEKNAVHMLGRLLSDDGFLVDVVSDGADAVKHLAEHPLPDAIITNVTLPRVDGWSLAHFARSRGKEMPLVFVTEYPHLLEGHCEGLQPAPKVLLKPVDYPALTRHLKKVLGS